MYNAPFCTKTTKDRKRIVMMISKSNQLLEELIKYYTCTAKIDAATFHDIKSQAESFNEEFMKDLKIKNKVETSLFNILFIPIIIQ